MRVKEKVNQYIKMLSAVILVVLMIGASEIFGEKEIIFPEIAAIAAGMFAAPKIPWKTNRLRILLLITTSAVIGVLFVLYLPLPKWGQMSLAFLICQIILAFSGTSFAPMLSAAILPIMLGTKSIVYPVAAVALTTLILLTSLVLERLGFTEKTDFSPLPLPKAKDYINIIFRSVIVAVLIFIALFFDFRFAVAPPLLVAFCELSKPECPARKRPFSVIMLVTACALIGAVTRLLMCVWLCLPLTLAAVVVGVGFILAMRAFKMYLPPAAALAVLALLVPEECLWLYSVNICVGISVLLCVSLALFKKD